MLSSSHLHAHKSWLILTGHSHWSRTRDISDILVVNCTFIPAAHQRVSTFSLYCLSIQQLLGRDEAEAMGEFTREARARCERLMQSTVFLVNCLLALFTAGRRLVCTQLLRVGSLMDYASADSCR